MRTALDDRSLLLNETRSEVGFAEALTQQQGRLTALDLLPGREAPTTADSQAEQPTCPACRSQFTDPDPTAVALRDSLLSLRAQVGDVAEARPARRGALAELDDRITGLRGQLRSTNAALLDLHRGQQVADRTAADTRDFTRGRIDATLERATLADETQLQLLRQQLQRAEERVGALEAELDEDNSREQLTSRLVMVGRTLSAQIHDHPRSSPWPGVRRDHHDDQPSLEAWWSEPEEVRDEQVLTLAPQLRGWR